MSDAAGGSIYTDSFNASLGTSFSAPLVAGTVGADAVGAAVAHARPGAQRCCRRRRGRFPTTGGDNGDGTPCRNARRRSRSAPPQIDQLQCYCTTTTCGAGMLDAGAAVLAAHRP